MQFKSYSLLIWVVCFSLSVSCTKYNTSDQTGSATKLVSGPASSLRLVGPTSTEAVECSGPFSAQFLDANGLRPTDVASGTPVLISGAQKIFSDDRCQSELPNSEVLTNLDAIATFYVPATKAGSSTFIGKSNALSSAAPFSVVAAPAHSIRTSIGAIVQNVCTPVTINVVDAFANPADLRSPVSVALSAVGLSGANFFGSADCVFGTEIFSTNLQTGTRTKVVYFVSQETGQVNLRFDPMPYLTQEASNREVTAGTPRKVILRGPSGEIAAGSCIPYTVALQNENGTPFQARAPIAVPLQILSGSATLWSNSICSSPVQGGTVTIAAGQSSIQFYAVTTSVPLLRLEGTSAGFSSGQVETALKGAVAASVVWEGVPAEILVGRCSGEVRLRVKDRFGNNTVASQPITVKVPTSGILAAESSVFAGPNCSGGKISQITLAAGVSSSSLSFLATAPGAIELTPEAMGITTYPLIVPVKVPTGTPASLALSLVSAVPAGRCASITISARGANNLPILSDRSLPILLTDSNPQAGYFSTRADCSEPVPELALTLPAGQEYVTGFYVSTLAGPVTITASDSGQPLTAGAISQALSVQYGVASQLLLNAVPSTVASGACFGPLAINLADRFGNIRPAPSSLDLSLTPDLGVQYFSNSACTSAISSVTLLSGQSTSLLYARANYVLNQSSRILVRGPSPLQEAQYDLTVVPPAPLHLSFDNVQNGLISSTADNCQQIIVSSRNPQNTLEIREPITVFFSSTSQSSPIFFTNGGRTALQNNSITISSANNPASICIQNQKAETFTIYASSGITSVATSALVQNNPGQSSRISFVGALPSILMGSCSGPFIVEVQDRYGNPVGISSRAFSISTLPANFGRFYADSVCQNSSLQNQNGYARFGFFILPSAVGTTTLTAGLGNLAPDSRVISIDQKASVEISGAGVLGQSIDFGNVEVKKSSARIISVLNPSSTQSISNFVLGSLPAPFSMSLTPEANACTNSGTLAPRQICTISLRYSPLSVGAQTGSFTLSFSDASGNSQSLTLSLRGIGIQPSVADLTVDPTNIDFGKLYVGSTVGKSIKVRNAGSLAADQILVSGASGAVKVSGCAVTLNPGEECDLTVTAAASASSAGSLRQELKLNYLSNQTPKEVTGIIVSASVLTPALLAAQPSLLDMGGVAPLEQKSTAVGISNSGSGSAIVTSVSVNSPAFSVSSQCGLEIAGNSSCHVTVGFSGPQSAGTYATTLSIQYRSSGGADSITLLVPVTASVLRPGLLSISPVTVSFGQVLLNKSAVHQIIATNNGDLPISNIEIVPATDLIGYSLEKSSSCNLLDKGKSCFIDITFTPTSSTVDYNKKFSLRFSSGGQSNRSSEAISLSGSGILPASISIAPTTIEFGSVFMGVASQPVKVTLTNTQGFTAGALTIPKGGNGIAVSNSSCGASIPAQGSCTFTLVWTPAVAAAQFLLNQNETVTYHDGVATKTLSLPLRGTALKPGVLASTLNKVDFGIIQIPMSQAKVLSFTVSSSGVAKNIQLVSPLASPFAIKSVCKPFPFDLANEESCLIEISYLPSISGDYAFALQLSYTSGAASAKFQIDLLGKARKPGVLSINPVVPAISTTVGVSKNAEATVTNAGESPVTELSLTPPNSPFAIVSNSCLSALPVGQSCKIVYSCNPQTSGSFSDVNSRLSFQSHPDLPARVSLAPFQLSCTANSAGLLVQTPASLDFGEVRPGASRTLPVTLVNNGQSSVTNLSFAANFSQFSLSRGDCPASILPGQRCNLSATYVASQLSVDSARYPISYFDGAANITSSLILTGHPVPYPPATSSFSIAGIDLTKNPIEVAYQGQTLSFSVAGTNVATNGCTLSGRGAPANAFSVPLSFSVAPNFTGVQPAMVPITYVLSCKGLNGSTYTFSRTINFLFVSGNLTVDGGVGPVTKPYGSKIRVAWSSSLATSCRVNFNSDSSVIGTTLANVGIDYGPIYQGEHRVYLTCQGQGGPRTITVNVNVAAPLITFNEAGILPLTSILKGGGTLTIPGTNLVDGSGNTSVYVGDKACAILTKSATQITCTIPSGVAANVPYSIQVRHSGAVKEAVKKFTYVNPRIVSFTANNASGTLTRPDTGNVTFSWVTADVTACTFNPGNISVATSGSRIVTAASISATTTYTLSCTSSVGAATPMSVVVQVPQLWYPTHAQSCATVCSGLGKKATVDAAGNACLSAEARPASKPTTVDYVHCPAATCLPGTATNTVSVGAYCYMPGQKRDNDVTDHTVACACSP